MNHVALTKGIAIMKTIIHTYGFDTTKPDEYAAWAALKAKLATWPPPMDAKADDGPTASAVNYRAAMAKLDGATIELETAHLFDNQWSTAPIPGVSDSGLRVFDWRINRHYNLSFISGHWLEQTAEMIQIREQTHACGYCGKQEPASAGLVFCPHCIDSEYLKASDLPLTRMRRVSEGHRYRVPDLTEAELAERLPLFKRAQLTGITERGIARMAKARADIKIKYEREREAARLEFEGFTWFMDKGINTDNLIFYSHTGRFCFGWRNKVDAELLSAVLDVVSEFPYPYDIKTADGRTLSGG
jgi:hypothetical protein